jgi:TIR domain
MQGTFDELSDEDKSLAAARAKADYVVNSAIDWISRFHSQFPGPLIFRLLEGIRDLVKSTQGRSCSTIEDRISRLLEVQSSMLLPSSGVPLSPHTQAKSSLPTADIPRLHVEWDYEAQRFARGGDAAMEARRGSPVFISYARADSSHLSRVLVHLRPLERSGRVALWHDGKLIPGRPWRRDLDQALMTASVAVLIVTANFMASDFIHSSELPQIVARARDEGVHVYPVIFGHCLLDDDPHLARLQLFNDPERPLSHLPPAESDALLVKLAKSIRDRA